MRPARIENQRLPAAQPVLEEGRQTRIPPLREPRGHPRGFLFFRIEIDVEMLGVQHLEIEFVVLNLVAAEVTALRRHIRGGSEDEREGHGEG
jgi:hypothetical protein